jgi:hypothetical protein
MRSAFYWIGRVTFLAIFHATQVLAIVLLFLVLAKIVAS